MYLTDLLTFCLSSAGLTIFIVASEIMTPVRDFLSKNSWLKKLINCSQCTGVWVGALLSLHFGVNPIIGASIASVTSWSIHNIVDAANSIAVNLDITNKEEE